MTERTNSLVRFKHPNLSPTLIRSADASASMGEFVAALRSRAVSLSLGTTYGLDGVLPRALQVGAAVASRDEAPASAHAEQVPRRLLVLQMLGARRPLADGADILRTQSPRPPAPAVDIHRAHARTQNTPAGSRPFPLRSNGKK